MPIYRSLIFVFILIHSSFAFSDTVWMKNGDIISGSIKLIDNNKLILENKYAGSITIKTPEIKTFSLDQPTIIKNDLYDKKYHIDLIKPSEEEGTILMVDNHGEEQTVSITNNLILIKEKPNSLTNEYTFNGTIKGGFFYEKGTKKTEQYLLDTDLVIKHDLWRHNPSFNLRRSLKNDSVSTYYYTVQYNLDKFVTPKFFWQSNAQYRHDWIEDITAKKSFGAGPGYQLWDNELSSFSLALLLNYQEMDYRDDKQSRHPLGTIRWNYQRFFNGKAIRLFTNGSIGRGFNDTVTLDLSATAGVSYKVTDWFILSSTFNKDKDRTKDGNTDNINYNLGVGFTW